MSKKTAGQKLGERLQKARAQAGLTQSELAYRMGISPQSISAFESGRIVPSAQHLQKFAQFTHQPLYMFTGQKVAELQDRLQKMAIEIQELQTLVSQIVEQGDEE